MSDRKYPSRPWISTHGIIFDQNYRVLLTKRAAPPKQNYWFPPGGVVDLGETVLEALKREILEETGISVKNLRFIDFLDAISHDESGKILYHFVVHFYIGEYLSGILQAADDALEAMWIPIDKIKNRSILVPDELIQLLNKISNKDSVG